MRITQINNVNFKFKSSKAAQSKEQTYKTPSITKQVLNDGIHFGNAISSVENHLNKNSSDLYNEIMECIRKNEYFKKAGYKFIDIITPAHTENVEQLDLIAKLFENEPSKLLELNLITDNKGKLPAHIQTTPHGIMAISEMFDYDTEILSIIHLKEDLRELLPANYQQDTKGLEVIEQTFKNDPKTLYKIYAHKSHTQINDGGGSVTGYISPERNEYFNRLFKKLINSDKLNYSQKLDLLRCNNHVLDIENQNMVQELEHKIDITLYHPSPIVKQLEGQVRREPFPMTDNSRFWNNLGKDSFGPWAKTVTRESNSSIGQYE